VGFHAPGLLFVCPFECLSVPLNGGKAGRLATAPRNNPARADGATPATASPSEPAGGVTGAGFASQNSAC
jgi:hypothetical protein